MLAALAASLPVYAEEIHVTQEDAIRAAVAKVAPEYSPVAKQLRLQGEVKLDVVINEEGSIEKVGTTTGNPVLVQCAKEALKHWKFTPFKADGKTVKALATLDFTFKM
jgi:TonB family protein